MTQIESPTITVTQTTNEIAALRDKVAALMPDIIPEMLRTDSITALMQSIDESRAVYNRLTGAPASPPPAPAQEPAPAPPAPPSEPAPTPQAIAPQVPAGAAPFTEDLSKLSAMELITRGLKQRTSQ